MALLFFPMRYHYEKPSVYVTMYGSTYECNHPVYNSCTLFQMIGVVFEIRDFYSDYNGKEAYLNDFDYHSADHVYRINGDDCYRPECGRCSVHPCIR